MKNSSNKIQKSNQTTRTGDEIRIPPSSIDTEVYLLAVMLKGDTDEITEILDMVSSDDFYDNRHKTVFEIIAMMYYSNEAIDLVTVSNKLQDSALLEMIGGSSYLATIVNTGIGYRNFRDYARIIKEKAKLRKVIDKSYELQKKAFAESEVSEMINDAVEIETELNEYVESYKSKEVNPTQLIDKLKGEIGEFKKGRTVSVPTGYPTMDGIVDGFIVPHIWIIGGDTGTGKTFFTLSLLVNLMRGGLRPILFSTENSATRNITRLIGCMTGYHEMKIMKGIWNSDENEKINAAMEELKTFPLIIYDNVFDTREIRLKAKKHKVKDKSNAIVIDYIQNLDTSGDVYKQMSGVALDLQKMANELGMGVIAVSQIPNSDKANRGGSVEYKGAGEIKAIADIAIWLKRKENDPHKMMVRFQKVRHGMPGKIIMDFFTDDVKAKGKYMEESGE